MELLRRIIAASIIAAGLAAPVFSCPGAAVPQAGCALQVAADVPPCHRSAGRPMPPSSPDSPPRSFLLRGRRPVMILLPDTVSYFIPSAFRALLPSSPKQSPAAPSH
jgi:hypothetical protein